MQLSSTIWGWFTRCCPWMACIWLSYGIQIRLLTAPIYISKCYSFSRKRRCDSAGFGGRGGGWRPHHTQLIKWRGTRQPHQLAAHSIFPTRFIFLKKENTSDIKLRSFVHEKIFFKKKFAKQFGGETTFWGSADAKRGVPHTNLTHKRRGKTWCWQLVQNRASLPTQSYRRCGKREEISGKISYAGGNTRKKSIFSHFLSRK